MRKFIGMLAVILVALSLPLHAYSQEAKAPVYKDGDWWKVKYELKDGSSGRNCTWQYPEYVVKIESGKPIVYGVQGKDLKKLSCTEVEAIVLGTGRDGRERLKFPLRIGKTWKGRFIRAGNRKRRPLNPEYNVVGLETIQTPKGDFEAFKLTSFYSYEARRAKQMKEFSSTYYYSPKVKAMISRKSISPGRKRIWTLVDFNVSE